MSISARATRRRSLRMLAISRSQSSSDASLLPLKAMAAGEGNHWSLSRESHLGDGSDSCHGKAWWVYIQQRQLEKDSNLRVSPTGTRLEGIVLSPSSNTYPTITPLTR